MNTPTSASPIRHDGLDRLIMSFDTALRTVFAEHQAARPCPQAAQPDGELSAEDKRQSAALMRVNHVGEVCAQALYASQAWGTNDPVLKAQFDEAAREETDHLAWTEQRLKQLGSRTSLLNPLWYAGAFAVGLAASKISDGVSLGFVVETENQVAAHLQSHLRRLPEEDLASRAVVARMKDDEERHAINALAAGAIPLPAPARALMRAAAKVMTTTAHYV